jgi:hypothetical protein
MYAFALPLVIEQRWVSVDVAVKHVCIDVDVFARIALLMNLRTTNSAVVIHMIAQYQLIVVSVELTTHIAAVIRFTTRIISQDTMNGRVGRFSLSTTRG